VTIGAKNNNCLLSRKEEKKIIDINGKDITKRKPSTYKCLSNQ
jgi:hypothetical protein